MQIFKASLFAIVIMTNHVDVLQSKVTQPERTSGSGLQCTGASRNAEYIEMYFFSFLSTASNLVRGYRLIIS